MVPSRVLYHDVSCRNCYKSICPLGHHACLARIAPQRIVEAVAELLDGRDGTRAAVGVGVGVRSSVPPLHALPHVASSPLPLSGWPAFTPL